MAKTTASNDDFVEYTYYPNCALSALLFAREITLEISTTDSLHTGIRIEVFRNVYVDQYEKVEDSIKKIENGSVSYNVTISGLIKIALTGVDNQGYSIGTNNTNELTVRSDVTPPDAPYVDTSAFDYYSIDPVTVSFYINSDATSGSGINYARSSYSFINALGQPVPELTRNLTSDDAQLKYINNIKQNGTLCFYIYDLVGNLGTFSYPYVRHGYQNTPVPIIILTPQTQYTNDDIQYTTAMYVTIDFGIIDDSTKREYTLITPTASVTRNYTEPFTITYQFTVTIRAYYYVNNEKIYVEAEISNIDTTPPDLTDVVESAQIICDIKADVPIYINIHVTDEKSGIRKVYAVSGAVRIDLDKISEDHYFLNIMNITKFTLYAEDNAGNQNNVVFGGLTYDYTTISTYKEIYQNLDQSLYVDKGWEAVITAYDALSAYINNPTGDTGYIQALITNLNDTIKGVTNISVKISDVIGLEIPGAVEFAFNSDTFDMKRGDSVTVLLGTIKATDAEINSTKQKAIELYNDPDAFAVTFALSLTKDDSEKVPSVIGTYTMDIVLDNNITNCKVYLKTVNGLIELESELSNNNLIVKATDVGEFYIVGVKPTADSDSVNIFGRMISKVTVIIVSTCIAVFLIAILIIVLIMVKTRRKSNR
ncbi:MAG: hypothetical protein LBF68_03055 [Christensenellaceae bacterium]|nr:hypothetical protein [Christensenellaceae bacterium]